MHICTSSMHAYLLFVHMCIHGYSHIPRAHLYIHAFYIFVYLYIFVYIFRAFCIYKHANTRKICKYATRNRQIFTNNRQTFAYVSYVFEYVFCIFYMHKHSPSDNQSIFYILWLYTKIKTGLSRFVVPLGTLCDFYLYTCSAIFSRCCSTFPLLPLHSLPRSFATTSRGSFLKLRRINNVRIRWRWAGNGQLLEKF